MSDGTAIQWSEATWNIATGCTKVSDGCDHCYIERTPPFRMNRRSFDKPGIGGTTGVILHPERLATPTHWAKPRLIFVNSLADLFHEGISADLIAKAFAVMALTPQHTYQVLSKRHARMRSLFNRLDFQNLVAREIDALSVDLAHRPAETWRPIRGYAGYEASSHGRVRSQAKEVLRTSINPDTGRECVTLWNRGKPRTETVHRLVLMAHEPTSDPSLEVCHRNGDKTDNRLANLRWGTRSENQRDKVRHGSRGGPQRLTSDQVDEIRALRRNGVTQQAIADRFGISRSLVSLIDSGRAWAEPDIVWPLPNVHLGVSAETQSFAQLRIPALLDTPAAVRWVSAEPLLGPLSLRRWLGTPEPGINWVVLGGESGPGARPMDLDWARSIVGQCRESGVPVFVKQLGSVWAKWAGAKHHKGGDPVEWPEDLRVREMPRRREAAKAGA